MADYVLAIVQDVEKLAKRSEEVLVVGADLNTRPEVSALIKDLKDTILANKDLVALAAPQLGHSDRLFCIRFDNGDIRTFINPMISKTEGLHLVREISPSLPGRAFIVPRHDRIIAIYQTPTGKPEENIFEGAVAEVFQHMVNLLDGVLVSDFGLEVFEDFDKATDEERNQVLNAYLDELRLRAEKINKEIDSNEDLKKTRDAIEFMKDVATGKVQLEKAEDASRKPNRKTRRSRKKKETKDA